MNEVWKELPENPIYEISSYGNIRNKTYLNIRKLETAYGGYSKSN